MQVAEIACKHLATLSCIQMLATLHQYILLDQSLYFPDENISLISWLACKGTYLQGHSGDCCLTLQKTVLHHINVHFPYMLHISLLSAKGVSPPEDVFITKSETIP